MLSATQELEKAAKRHHERKLQSLFVMVLNCVVCCTVFAFLGGNDGAVYLAIFLVTSKIPHPKHHTRQMSLEHVRQHGVVRPPGSL